MIAKVKKVKLKGNTIENISLGSIARLQSLKLRKGDKVKVLYDIIPYLSFDDECEHRGGELIEIPEVCPDCGEKLEFSDNMGIASCVNPKCPCREKGKIINYLNKMNIDNMSYGVIDKLYEYDIVKSIKDLYRLNDRALDIVSFDGFGHKSLVTWLDEIDSHRDVEAATLFGAIGIEGISEKTFRKIFNKITPNKLLEIAENEDYAKLIEIPGIQDKSAKKIVDGINENKKLIKFLTKELNVQITNPSDIKFLVCFTKVRDKQKEELIKSFGGSITDDLTKNVNLLVVKSKDTESSKTAKAKKYGIPIVTIDELDEELLSQF